MITNDINVLAKELANGNVVAFRTDTVYGLSSSIGNSDAVAKIFELKRRNDGKPLIVLVPIGYHIDNLVHVTDNAKKLIDKFWPGPLTIIFKLKGKVAKGITPYDTLSLRMPNDSTCQEVLQLYGEPITSTSCNISGQPILNNALDIDKTFDIAVLDGGVCDGGVPSTIVDCSSNAVKVLREGGIKESEILKTIKMD